MKPRKPLERIQIGKTLEFVFNEGCQFDARKRCNENPTFHAVKIDYIAHESEKSGKCFCLTGDVNEIMLACTKQHPDIMASTDPKIMEFVDCARSTHEMILEPTEERQCPIHLFFDFEINKEWFGSYGVAPDVDEVLTPMVIDIIFAKLREWALTTTPDMFKNVICMSGTRPDKYSMHVLCKNMVFPSLGILQAFGSFLSDAIQNMDPFKMYPNRIVDFGVYKLHASLRMLYMCKAFNKSQWDKVKRTAKKNYPVYPIRFLPTPLYPTDITFSPALFSNEPMTYIDTIHPNGFFGASAAAMASQIIACSIGMDTKALAVVNIAPKVLVPKSVRAKPTYKGSGKRSFQVLTDGETEVILDQMYEKISLMRYWPRECLIESFKSTVEQQSLVFDITSPAYVFRFHNGNAEVGLACFRDPAFYQPNALDPKNDDLEVRMHCGSPITLNVYPNGEIYQTCYPHAVGFRVFPIGNYLANKCAKLSDSFGEELPAAPRLIGKVCEFENEGP